MIIESLGIVAGLVGPVIADFFKGKEADRQATLEVQRLEIQGKFELQSRNLDLQIMRQEAAAAERKQELVLESQSMVTDSEILRASYDHDRAEYYQGDSRWLVAANFIRIITRPVLTIGLICLSAAIYFNEPVNSQLAATITSTVVGCTNSAVLWWFYNRQKKNS